MAGKQKPQERTFEVIDDLDPLAREGVRIASRFTEADQRFVFNKLHARFSNATPRTERQTLALSCYLRALESLGKDGLGEDGYTAWYRAQPRGVRETLLSGPSIRRNMGGWAAVRKAVDAVPLASFKSVERRAVGKSFSLEEVVMVLKRFAADHEDEIHSKNYPSWAEAERAAGRRVPRHFSTLHKRFPSRREMHRAAGLEYTSISKWVRHTDESIVSVVVEARRSIQDEMTERNFNIWRQAKAENGRSVPSATTIADRFGNGSWNEARDRCLAIAAGGDA